MRLLRDLGRRKLRSALTITGILIGIMALVVFGSMANKIDSLVKGGSDYYKDKVVVSAKGGMMGLGGVDVDRRRRPRSARSTASTSRSRAWRCCSPTSRAASAWALPPMITGGVAGADRGRETFHLDYASGRALTAADEGRNVVVLGSDLARQHERARSAARSPSAASRSRSSASSPRPSPRRTTRRWSRSRRRSSSSSTTLPPLVSGEARPGRGRHRR